MGLAERSISEDPANVNAYRLLAIANYINGDMDAARQCIKNAKWNSLTQTNYEPMLLLSELQFMEHHLGRSTNHNYTLIRSEQCEDWNCSRVNSTSECSTALTFLNVPGDIEIDDYIYSSSDGNCQYIYYRAHWAIEYQYWYSGASWSSPIVCSCAQLPDRPDAPSNFALMMDWLGVGNDVNIWFKPYSRWALPSTIVYRHDQWRGMGPDYVEVNELGLHEIGVHYQWDVGLGSARGNIVVWQNGSSMPLIYPYSLSPQSDYIIPTITVSALSLGSPLIVNWSATAF